MSSTQTPSRTTDDVWGCWRVVTFGGDFKHPLNTLQCYFKGLHSLYIGCVCRLGMMATEIQLWENCELKLAFGCNIIGRYILCYSHRFGEHSWDLLAALVVPTTHTALVKLPVGVQLAIAACLNAFSLNTYSRGVRRAGCPIHNLQGFRHHIMWSFDGSYVSRNKGENERAGQKMFATYIIFAWFILLT